MDLPALDISLLINLPKLISPDLQRLRESIEDDDPDRDGNSPPSPNKSTHPNNPPSSPTRSPDYATNVG
jgi:hypothetical protein